MRRPLQLGAGIVISAACIVVAVRGLSLAEIAQALSGASYPLLIPALALYFAGVWVRAVRWRVLLQPLRDVSSARLFPVVVIGYMANDVLPFRLGEVARCFVLRRREGIPQTAALGTVLLERIMDGVTMLAFVAATLPFVPTTAEVRARLPLLSAAFGVVTVCLIALALRPQLVLRLLGAVLFPLPAALRERVVALASTFLSGFASLGGAGGVLRVFALSCGAWLFEAAMYFVLMYAFPLTRSFPVAVLTTAVANLGGLIPAAPGSVGVFETFAKTTIQAAGADGGNAALAFAYVVVVHAALIVPITLLGFVYAWREGVTFGKLSQESVSTATATG